MTAPTLSRDDASPDTGALPPAAAESGNAPSTWLLQVIGIALVYAALDALGQQLAPAQHPALLRPAAGLALAALLMCGTRCWPGVWIGAFVVQWWPDMTLAGARVAALIAGGAALQAVFAAVFTRRVLEDTPPLARERDVAYFLLVGGPLACLISTNVAIATLDSFGRVAQTGLYEQWLSWWVGDTLGVLLFTPLTLLLWPGRQWSQVEGSRHIALTLVITAVLLSGGNYGVGWLQQSREREALALEAEQARDNALLVLSTDIGALRAVERFLVTQEEFDQNEFSALTSFLFSRPEVLAVDWAPRITRAQREQFEAALRDRGHGDAGITSRDAQGNRIVAGDSATYFPVQFSLPQNTDILGIDHGRDAQRMAAMAYARDHASPALSAVVPSLRSKREVMLIFDPVYRKGLDESSASIEERREALRGFVVGVFDVDRFFAPLLRAAQKQRLLLRLTDISDGSPRRVLVNQFEARTATGWSTRLDFGGRSWLLEMQSIPGRWRRGANFQTQMYLGFSVLAAFLVAYASLGGAGRAAAAATLVAERTAWLNYSNRQLETQNLVLQTEIDERKRAEDERNRFFELSLDMLCLIRADGYFKRVSPAFTQTLGWSAEQLLSRPIIDFVHSSDHAATQRMHKESGEQSVHGFENRFRHSDGSWRVLSWKSVPGPDGMIYATARDVTEQRKLEAELISAREAAENASRAKSAFLAIMSHEIRTPMNGVVGMVDLLKHSKLSEYQGDLVSTIAQSAQTLLELIDDILDFSKIEAGHLELEETPVSVGDIVEGLCTSLLPMATAKGVSLALFISPEVPAQILSDPLRLRQLLYNLLGNAIKFTAGQQQRKGRVSVRVEKVDTVSLLRNTPVTLRFTIADNGVGMNRETVDKLFTAFTQAEASTTRRFGGTGLGLTICKRLVDAMEGRIEVDSLPGEGSVFTVTLPFTRVESAPAPLPRLTEVKCIVMVSNRFSVSDLRVYLEHAGATVTVARDQNAALEAVAGAGAEQGVVIQYAENQRRRDDIRAAFAHRPRIRHLLLTPGQHRVAVVEAHDMVRLDCDLLRPGALVRAVAVAAGLMPPEPAEEATDVVTNHTSSALSTAEARQHGQLILVVEDDPVNQKVILQQLRLLGYAGEVADNGEEALERWRSGNYALVLTDIHMPEMDGYTLARSIRAEESGGRPVPILALTANALRGEATRASEAGMNEYLVKPTTLKVLQASLQRWLPATQEGRDEINNPPLELDVMRGLVGNDEDTVTELLNDYLASARELSQQIQDAHARRDNSQLAALAHRLKSSSRSVGALPLAGLCATLETAAKSDAPETVAQAMKGWTNLFQAVESAILAYFKANTTPSTGRDDENPAGG